jgi:hypothetical protein
MSKALKINLLSQSEIRREGTKRDVSIPAVQSLPVGRMQTLFYLPELKIDSTEDSPQESSPPVQKVISRINKFIENIADDYFFLGLHLISLHSLLRESKLTTAQIKSWYAENINMPYSSAMQCRKVAEVYSENPELIGRYTASGAYLLSSCKTPEEREEIWQEARGEKSNPSIRELRETLKSVQEKQLLEQVEDEEQETQKGSYAEKYRMSPDKIRESLQSISAYCDNLAACEKIEEQAEMRATLLNSVRLLLKKLEQKT